MADRYTYVPLIGLLIMIVWGAGELLQTRISRIPERNSKSTPTAKLQPRAKGSASFPSSLELGAWGFCAGMCLLTCAVLTSRQLTFWRNSEALFRHAVQVTKNNYLAYNNLGFYLANKGKNDEAMQNYHESLKINPVYEDALNNLGYALAGKKKFQEAIPYY